MIPVLLLGAAARRALAPGEGRVLAVFRRSIYLEREDGALACLGPPALGAGPLNALCGLPEGFDWERQGLAPGAAFTCDGEEVRIAGGAFSMREAQTWRPASLSPEWTAGTLGAGLAALARMARPPAEGMGGLIVEMIAPQGHRRGVQLNALADPDGITPPQFPPCQEGERGGGVSDPFRRLAWLAACAFCDWLAGALRGASSPPPEEAAGLLGLGPGLTPSGDDFLGGAMVALRALGEGRAAGRLAAWALPLARERTGRISLAHLACAAEGEGASALHDALAALCAPGAPGLAEALAALGAVGHTSGWDALAGAAAACAARLPARGPGEGIRTRAGFEGRAPAPL